MKTLFIQMLVLLALYIPSSAQIKNDTLHLHQDYTQIADQYFSKSKQQKATSIVLGVSGCILLLTGTTLAAASFNGFMQPGAKHHTYGNAPGILALIGGAMIAVAIPYSIAYRKNKKKAGLYTQKASVIITPVFTLPAHLTSVGITIRL